MLKLMNTIKVHHNGFMWPSAYKSAVYHVTYLVIFSLNWAKGNNCLNRYNNHQSNSISLESIENASGGNPTHDLARASYVSHFFIKL